MPARPTSRRCCRPAPLAWQSSCRGADLLLMWVRCGRLGTMPETPDGFPIEVPTHRLAHLSDTHLTSRDVLYNNRIDADAAVGRAAAVLRRAARDGRPVDALVVTGDLTDTG